MANNEKRKALDLSDIESLIDYNKAVINWELVKEYFDLFGFKDLFKKLRNKYGND